MVHSFFNDVASFNWLESPSTIITLMLEVVIAFTPGVTMTRSTFPCGSFLSAAFRGASKCIKHFGGKTQREVYKGLQVDVLL